MGGSGKKYAGHSKIEWSQLRLSQGHLLSLFLCHVLSLGLRVSIYIIGIIKAMVGVLFPVLSRRLKDIMKLKVVLIISVVFNNNDKIKV